jgi:hypothetical protein
MPSSEGNSGAGGFIANPIRELDRVSSGRPCGMPGKRHLCQEFVNYRHALPPLVVMDG